MLTPDISWGDEELIAYSGIGYLIPFILNLFFHLFKIILS